MFFTFILENATGDQIGMSATANQYMTSKVVNQMNNSPKSLSRLEIYRQTRNALNV